jgi:hypothetical protein
MAERLDAETWARVAARVAKLDVEERARVLEETGVDPEVWRDSDAHYRSELDRAIQDDSPELPRLYAAACVAEVQRRAREKEEEKRAREKREAQASVESFSLETYAALCAVLENSRSPDDACAELGIDGLRKAELDELWSQRFERDPSLRARFEERLAAARAGLGRAPGRLS